MRWQVAYTLKEGGKVFNEVVSATSKEEAEEVIWMILDSRGKPLHKVESTEEIV